MAYARDCTFFVEGDDVPRINLREHAKIQARAVQDQIGNEMSRLVHEQYLDDIMDHVRRMEEETLPDVHLIDQQREIQWSDRPSLIDFMVDATSGFALLPETLFLAVNLADRYCSRRTVYLHHYQLVGCAALLIAAKYGDKKDRVPQISEIGHMCCNEYTPEMFIQMEMHMLNTLEWTVGHTTVDFYLKLATAEEADPIEVRHMAGYLAEIALYHREFVSTRSSVIARASLTLARAILGRSDSFDGDWDQEDQAVMVALSQALRRPSVTLANKYASPHYSRASICLSEFLVAQAAIARRNAAIAAQAAALTPQSPPAEIRRGTAVYDTPAKHGHGYAHAAAPSDGYLTPPITPDSYLAPQQRDGFPVSRCPVTPTPQHGVYAYQHAHHAAQYAARHQNLHQ